MRRVLSIAGSDPSGGAGVQADLQTFWTHGLHGMSAITAITAQSTRRVVDCYATTNLESQLKVLFADMPPHAIKIGLIGSAAQVHLIADVLEQHPSIPVVLDPVIRSSSGTQLLPKDAIDPLVTRLLPLCTLITPNAVEAKQLAHGPAPEWATQRAHATLITGGDQGDPFVIDRLFLNGQVHVFKAKRVPGLSPRGTGCTLSSAICAQLALGAPLTHAVQQAISWTQAQIKQATGGLLFRRPPSQSL